ncbi:hypothetical protein DFJ73DRAFT_172509 [Zopfochytrium polystomum]|nr:hypothetical protein DFJ73DRAFT_172509 [Zopfochytrium polystomum]
MNRIKRGTGANARDPQGKNCAVSFATKTKSASTGLACVQWKRRTNRHWAFLITHCPSQVSMPFHNGGVGVFILDQPTADQLRTAHHNWTDLICPNTNLSSRANRARRAVRSDRKTTARVVGGSQRSLQKIGQDLAERSLFRQRRTAERRSYKYTGPVSMKRHTYLAGAVGDHEGPVPAGVALPLHKRGARSGTLRLCGRTRPHNFFLVGHERSRLSHVIIPIN